MDTTAGEQFSRACELDAAGFLIKPGEDAADYFERIERIRSANQTFFEQLQKEGKCRLFGEFELRMDEWIDPGVIKTESGEATWAFYGFAISHIYGFYISGQLGWLFGGCLAWDDESDLAVFLLRRAFEKKERFLIYNRRELMTHELCHGARHVLEDPEFEEFFAYRTGKGGVRKLLGGAFGRTLDSVLFVGPSFLLLACQVLKSLWLPGLIMWPFWLLTAAGPGYLACKAWKLRRLAGRAAENLKRFGAFEQPWPALFRLCKPEISELAKLKSREEFGRFDARMANEFRWNVIKNRFQGRM